MLAQRRDSREFFRACPIHLSEIIGTITAHEGETVRCMEGHVCLKWLIMDRAGVVVGMGHVDKPGTLLSGIFDKGDTDPRDMDIKSERKKKSMPYHVVKRRR